MADFALAPNLVPTIHIRRPGWLERSARCAEVLRRRARRNRYLALTGRSATTYPWFEMMFRSMSGR
jgi:hypothetical protein